MKNSHVLWIAGAALAIFVLAKQRGAFAPRPTTPPAPRPPTQREKLENAAIGIGEKAVGGLIDWLTEKGDRDGGIGFAGGSAPDVDNLGGYAF